MEEKLKRIKNDFVELGYNVDYKVRVGIASKNIMEVAMQEEVTLIALAKRGQGSIKELLLGITAEIIARQSKIPGLLFPAK